MMGEKKKFGLACDLVVPFWGAIRLLENGKWKEAGLSAAFSAAIVWVVITAMNEGNGVLGLLAYLPSNLSVNLASECFVDKRGWKQRT